MAYTVVYSVPRYSRNKFLSFKQDDNISPYMNWYKNNLKESVLFSFDEHRGPDICIHLTFIPDLDTESGVLLYRYNGDYTQFDVCAKILIDTDKKTLYIYNCIMDFEHFPPGSSNNDIKFLGGIKAFKKEEEYSYVINNMRDLFFGKDWRCYNRYTKKNICKDRKKIFKQLKNLTHLPYDIHEYIANTMIKWQNIKKVTYEDINLFKKIAENNVGAAVSEWSKIYAWGSVIGIYNPSIPESGTTSTN